MTFLRRHRGETEVQLQSIRNPPLGGGGWSTPRSGRFILEEDKISILHEGWLFLTTRKTSTPLWFDPWTVQSLPSHYSDYIIQVAI